MAKQIERKDIYRKKYNMKIETLEKEVNKIDIRELKELGNMFYENMYTLSMMVALPVMLCSQGYLDFSKVLLALEARLKSKIPKLKWEDTSKEDKKRYLEEEKRIWETKYKPKAKQTIEDAIKDAEKKFSSLLKEDIFYRSYRSLLYSGIIFIWCSFEVFMKDLWETALNNAGKRVKKMALVNIEKIEHNEIYSGIRGKYISLDYLGQYNFNVSKKLGSVLVNKFDFTSPYGIREAFFCLFPRSKATKEALENEGLIQLEAIRSVIVHRAGTIDMDFCKKTAIDNKEIGSILQLSDEEVYDYGNMTIDIALKVTKAVSSILSSNTKKTKPK